MSDPVPQNKMNSVLGRHPCTLSCTCMHMNTHRHKSKVKQVCKNTGDSYSNNKAEYGDTCLSSRGQVNPEGKYYVILLMWNLENVQFIEMWSRIVASRNKEE